MPIIHLAERALVRLSGPDARPFLQGLLTQDVERLSATAPLHAGLLSPQGKALFQLFLFADGADLLIDVEAAQLDALVRRLGLFRLRRQVAIAPEPGLQVRQAWGDVSLPDRPADPRTPLAGQRFVARPADPLAAPAGPAEWHAHRLRLGLPDADEIGSDELLWLEANARELEGVSFTKGCYTGQENTARMHHRDKLRKRLLPLRLARDAPLDALVMAGDRVAGDLRGRRHGDLQMALVRTEHAADPLSVGGAPAELRRPPWLPDPD